MIKDLMKRIELNMWRKIWNPDKYNPMPDVEHIDFKWDSFTQTGRFKLKVDVALKKGLFSKAL